MQAQAAEFSGYAGNSAAFWREEFKTVCFDSFILKQAQHHIPSQPGSAQDWSPPGYGAGLSSPQ